MLKTAILLNVLLLLGISSEAFAHCQVPCGIYNDPARVSKMLEDVKTITKAVKQINLLSKKKDAQSKNQLTRWVITKEQHAEMIIRTISDYFLAQKIKPVSKNNQKKHSLYLDKLRRHHEVIVAAMKCKQNSSQKEVKKLLSSINGIKGDWK